MLTMRMIRNIAIEMLALLAGAIIYIVVMAIMLLACAYYKVKGEEL